MHEVHFMKKTELENKLADLRVNANAVENHSLKMASIDLCGALEEKYSSINKDDDDEIEKLGKLIENVTIAIKSDCAPKQKMFALAAIQDEINRLSLKAHMLEASAAFVKTLGAFVSVAWCAAWVLTLGAFYISTFPVGLIVDCVLASAMDGLPPIATVCLGIAMAPFAALETTLFKSVEKDKKLAHVTQEFKAEVNKTLLNQENLQDKDVAEIPDFSVSPPVRRSV